MDTYKSTIKIGDTLYRYEGWASLEGGGIWTPCILLKEYIIVGETPYFWKVNRKDSHELKERKVSKNARYPYAWGTKKEAWESFQARLEGRRLHEIRRINEIRALWREVFKDNLGPDLFLSLEDE